MVKSPPPRPGTLILSVVFFSRLSICCLPASRVCLIAWSALSAQNFCFCSISAILSPVVALASLSRCWFSSISPAAAMFCRSDMGMS